MNLHARIEAPTRSPITPTPDQAATIAALTELGESLGVTIDAGPLDESTTEPCDTDWMHGTGPVCLRGDQLCPACAKDALRWANPGDHIAVDVLRDGVAAAHAAAEVA